MKKSTAERQPGNPQVATVVEWASFRLAEGIRESDLMQASEALHEDFLSRQPGFAGRELLRDEDGRWADLLYWIDPASAAAAMQRAPECPACRRYFQLLAPADPANPAAGVLHFRRMKTYEPHRAVFPSRS